MSDVKLNVQGNFTRPQQAPTGPVMNPHNPDSISFPEPPQIQLGTTIGMNPFFDNGIIQSGMSRVVPPVIGMPPGVPLEPKK